MNSETKNVEVDNQPSYMTINGKRLTIGELREWRKKNASTNKARFQSMVASRTPPGGHEKYWGTGHESLSCAVPAAQAKEHHEWCQKEGLAGIEVKPDGTVVTNSPQSKDKYLKARGLIDANTAGSDTKCMRDKQAVAPVKRAVRMKRLAKRVRS